MSKDEIFEGSEIKKKPTIKEKNTEMNMQDFANAIATSVANAVAGAKQGPSAKAIANEIQTASVAAIKINERVQEKARRQQAFAARIRKEVADGSKAVVYAIPTIYKEFQPSFTVSINGCTIKIPADGKPYTIHKDYAAIISKRLRHLDAKIEAMNQSLRNSSYGITQTTE